MVDVAAVNKRIADGLGDRMVTIEDLPATVIEFRGDGAWHIASIVTERNLTRRMEPNELVVFDAGSNVKEILGQLMIPVGFRSAGERRRSNVSGSTSLLEDAIEQVRQGDFDQAERSARAAAEIIRVLKES